MDGALPTRSGLKLSGLALLAAVAVLMGGAVWFWATDGEGTVTPASTSSPVSQRVPGAGEPAPPVSPKPEAVVLTVVGAPAGATIFYGDTPISENPFAVGYSHKTVRLKVTAPNEAPFLKWIVPTEDQQIMLHRSSEQGDEKTVARDTSIAKSEASEVAREVKKTRPQTDRKAEHRSKKKR